MAELMPVDQLTLAEAQLEAALAEGPCLCICHKPGSGYSPPGYHQRHPSDAEADPRGFTNDEVDLACKWGCTGRVPLLPGLRKPCGCPKSIDGRKGWVSPCPSGRGSACPGWVPETDEFEVLAALPSSALVSVLSRLAWNLRASPTTEALRLDFWRAVAAWCRAQQEVDHA